MAGKGSPKQDKRKAGSKGDGGAKAKGATKAKGQGKGKGGAKAKAKGGAKAKGLPRPTPLPPSRIARQAVPHPLVAERVERGEKVRGSVPPEAFGEWEPAADRPDPVAVLEAQGETRVAELLPIRYGRMAASAFAFYRGAAAIMAADLGAGPRTNLTTQLCGDAHLANFGGFASPERSLVFDLNDFDETHPGPFEWDVMRLAASIEIAGRSRGWTEKERRQHVVACVETYRHAMREFATMCNLDVWYSHLSAEMILQRLAANGRSDALARFRKQQAKAEGKDRMKAMAKLTERVDGELRIVSNPPLVQPIEEIFTDRSREELEDTIRTALRTYRRTLARDRRHLLEQYRYVQTARKVVGVGSVGSRAWMVLLVGLDDEDPLFLQVKEAVPSVLEPYTRSSAFTNHGQRVVEGQRLMQASSDIFLGWQRVVGVDDLVHDYYVRQLWDWKASADLETITPDAFDVYVKICGWTLARAHARAGDRVAMTAYLGDGPAFERSMAAFAYRYADQNERDHAALVAAIESGRIEAQSGI